MKQCMSWFSRVSFVNFTCIVIWFWFDHCWYVVGSLIFSGDIMFAHLFARFWKQVCKQTNCCEALYYVVLFWNKQTRNIWFRNIRTLSMFDKLIHYDFFIVFQFSFRVRIVLQQWLFWFSRFSFVHLTNVMRWYCF